MPKLGLTMTEGAVARWVIAAGGRFKAGDVVAVIETDKIAYDFEAPAPGILHEILVSEGNVVPVGTPIGRWDIGDAKVDAATVTIEPAAHEMDAAPPVTRHPNVGSATRTSSARDDQRILATPYARRLAQIAKIDLRSLTGSGPRGRIKAADVNRSISEQTPSPLPPHEPTARVPSATPNLSQPAKFFSAGVDLDVSRLLALNEDIIQNLPLLRPQLVHYVILAASRVLGGAATHQFVIGLAASGDSLNSPVIFGVKDCQTLRSIVERADGRSNGATAASAGGTLWVTQAQEKISFISGEPPPGWPAFLGIGSVRAAFCPDASGRPIAASMVNLVITSRTAELDPTSAQTILDRIRNLLETPSYLLIS